MGKFKSLGQAMEIPLTPYGYGEGTAVVAFYRKVGLSEEADEKYAVTMYCIIKDKDGWLMGITPVVRTVENRIEHTQTMHSTKGMIRSNICRVVDYMCRKHIIDRSIPSLEEEE